ncbi:5-methylcytosine rRNA methyltransferase NSUN4 isoform X2 [Zootermopsis nevadensis]|uniref:NOL1/NOP2/Sun domain family member 4 n=1 Tax=Zootermopsis nevadensis TaxID=136037 RepID=A0A067R711_ZOONE|nr:5-methylcytosine rRNA methyltransferase NSUN4 isoform X2 [Zootermopsis nevadensis]KDR18203.1 Putative methyltransferase NSUN4 [Zootermopsis nevadensis]
MYTNNCVINSVCSNLCFRTSIYVQKRWKSKKVHWSVLAKKIYPVDKALEHFDDFYKTVFGRRWPSIRLALLSPHKYCAVINNFGDSDMAVSDLQNIGAMSMRRLFELEKETIKQQKQEDRRKKDLEKIFKLDRKLEQMMVAKQQKELESLYPHREKSESACVPADILTLNKSSSDTSHGSSVNMNRKDHAEECGDALIEKSLHSSLRDADFDTQRLIDPASGLSAAALYEYVPATRLKGMEDWIVESQHYRYYKKNTDFPVHIESDHDFIFPDHLQVLTFERGNVSSFPAPKRGSTGVLNYYLLDGGSLLPVLALGVNPGDRVLDMCAAPGGKSLLMLQTLFPALLVCNDVQESRTNRIHAVIKQYLYSMDKWKNRLIVTQRDGRDIDEYNIYNKILVDVPCTIDRHSLHENENNIFKPTRVKERLKIPEIQAELLGHALKLVQPGGTVVYSTCSLSPIQNDGVVHMALRKVWEETDIQVVVKDMTAALEPVNCMYKLGQDLGLKYGHLVLPFIPCNFGPMYFCKLVRRK